MDTVYALTGLLLFCFAWSTAADHTNPHRAASGWFWMLLGVIFTFGSVLPHWVSGIVVIVIVLIDGSGRVGRGGGSEAELVSRERARAGGSELGNKIFLPVVAIPAVTILIAIGFRVSGADSTRGALVGLGFGGIAALAVAMYITGSTLRDGIREGRRLNETMGAVNILPQLLASLGVIFTSANVGKLIADGIREVVPVDNLFLLILANCVGMTLFTILVGNSFAAFPVVAAGVLVPLLIEPFHLNPATAGILTLTAGSSGTLMTLMAANFNVVPAALLNMRDPYGVIKFQFPVAVSLWGMHVVLFWSIARWF